jgi:hypothetical protein
MNEDHWVPVSVIADFKKVKAITNDIQEVVSALRRSSKVQVDESGTMVKAIAVDRPRTTLILRDLPEDSTQEVCEEILFLSNPSDFLARGLRPTNKLTLCMFLENV